MPETGLIVEVPEAEALVGALRMRYDESARMGVPAHITVLFPFMEPASVTASVLAELNGLFSATEQFRFRLGSVGRFPVTCYLEPRPAAPFVSSGRWRRMHESLSLRNQAPDRFNDSASSSQLRWCWPLI